jgi:hypothetical protein
MRLQGSAMYFLQRGDIAVAYHLVEAPPLDARIHGIVGPFGLPISITDDGCTQTPMQPIWTAPQ